jgi:two-component system CheB/CheR fusion protein
MAEAGAPNAGLEVTDEEIGHVPERVRAVTGVDFSQYRQSTIERRVARRALLRSMPSIGDYAALLAVDRAEVEALCQDMLINVTSFFRDQVLFESLKRQVFPAILSAKPHGEAIRLWIAGCSTGQEAYSLLMALTEFLDSASIRPRIQLFGTDPGDEAALAVARAGVYPESIESEVSPERLQRFFRREGPRYAIDKSLRDVCVFAPHNVAADPPFSRIDLASAGMCLYTCRRRCSVVSWRHCIMRCGSQAVWFWERPNPLARYQRDIRQRIGRSGFSPRPRAPASRSPQPSPMPTPMRRSCHVFRPARRPQSILQPGRRL